MKQYNFVAYYGLCNNLEEFLYHTIQMNFEDRKLVKVEMQQQFEDAGLSPAMPFNGNGLFYLDEMDTRLNPARVTWAIEHALNPPAGQSEALTQFYNAWADWATS